MANARVRSRWRTLGRFAAVAALAIAIIGWGICRWLVPDLIVQQIRSVYGGRVAIGGWWIGGHSSGLIGVSLREGPSKSDPVWADLGRVQVDLGIIDLLRGRRVPAKVVVTNPKIAIRINSVGTPLTVPPFKLDQDPSAPKFPLPNVSIDGLELTFAQEGRPTFTAHGLQLRLTPDPLTNNQGAKFTGTVNDPYWGGWTVNGRLEPKFTRGDLTLSGGDVDVDLKKCLALPWVPTSVWDHIAPDGPLDATLFLAFDLHSKTAPITTRTTVVSKGATLDLRGLNLSLKEATGSAVVEGGSVKFSAVEGKAIGGKLRGDGTLDFNGEFPRLNLDLRMRQLQVARLREKWLPSAPRASGRLDGSATLKIAFTNGMVDLTDTSGSAKIADALIDGLPVENLKVALLKDRSIAGEVAEKPLIPGVRIPGTLTASGDWKGIEAREVIDRLVSRGLISPLPISGKLTVKADVRAPLDGRIEQPRAFAINADALLIDGTIAALPVAALSSRLNLEKGILTFNDVQGRLAAPKNASVGTPLAIKGFGSVGVDPLKELVFHVDTNSFSPAALAEVLGPQPLPIDGNVFLSVDAHVDAAHLNDSAAWTGAGLLTSKSLATTVADQPKIVVADLKTSIRVAKDRLDLPDLSAQLEGDPLTGSFGVDLKAPYAYAAKVDLPERDLAVWLGRLGENTSDLKGFDGLLSGRIAGRGTFQPLAYTVEGSGLLAHFRMENQTIGDLPFRFDLPASGLLDVQILDAKTFGGVVSAEVHAPIGRTAGPPKGINGSANLKNVDLPQIFALLPVESLPRVSGRANGHIEFLIPPRLSENLPATLPEQSGKGQVSSTLANVNPDDARINLVLNAPDLLVGKTRAEKLEATAWLRKRTVHYDLLAIGFGGSVKLVGDAALRGPGVGSIARVGARVKAAELELARIAEAFEVDFLRPLSGYATADVDVSANPADAAVWAKGDVWLSQLRWGSFGSFGRLNARFEYGPHAWKMDNLEGRLFGGLVTGRAWTEPGGSGKSTSKVELAIDRLNLADLLAFVPAARNRVKGFASLKLSGTREEGLRLDGQLTIPTALVFGVPVNSWNMPIEVETPLGSNIGNLRSRAFKGRVAGGAVRGDCAFRFGEDRTFHAKVDLSGMELETISRGLSNGLRPASGQITGTIALFGPNSKRPREYRGRIDLDLDNGKLFELPVLKELGRFLGSSSGSLFDDGDLHATIAGGNILIEQLTLQGKILQIHVTGTVGFDQRLNLEVLVNTPELISETGQALAGLIPGLGEAIGRRSAAVAKVGGYLSNKLLKFRVGGTISNPSINTDASVMVGEAAVGFFADVLRLPLNILR